MAAELIDILYFPFFLLFKKNASFKCTRNNGTFSGNQQRGNFPHTQFVNNNTLQSLDIFRRQNCSHLCDVLDPIHMNTFSFSMQGFDWESNPGHLMLDVILYGNCLLYGDERRREREPGERGRERRWRKSDGLMLPLVAVKHQLTWFPGCYKGRKKTI